MGFSDPRSDEFRCADGDESSQSEMDYLQTLALNAWEHVDALSKVVQLDNLTARQKQSIASAFRKLKATYDELLVIEGGG